MRPAYPSSKKVKDYDKLEAEDMRSARANHFFAQSTVLSIDWKDVGAKKIESTLHDDLALKTWKI
uniref:SGS domain-containing protein n=1 Tax=Brassica oleracea TaxID=3712 RepID=A0A3P6DUX0_BRAOL|nr:unnamed protein product [Brassica oleracea]